MKVIWTDFEHQVKSQWEKYFENFYENLQGASLVITVSGGADSVASFCALWRLSKYFKFKTSILHVHHGFSENIEVLAFREKAVQFVYELAKQYGSPFFCEQYKGAPLVNEEDFRDFRHQVFQDYKKKLNADFIVTGHQSDDLLETRVMRLIRGTGAQGLRSMGILDGQIFRPLLFMGRLRICQYLSEINQSFLIDPSNLETAYFRNWLRQEWLPMLEKQRPGSLESMARSLELVVESLNENQVSLPSSLWLGEGLSRPVFLTLAPIQQREALAKYLFRIGAKDFRQSQIEEIKKNLDISQIVHKFTVARLEWHINAERILAKPI